ncbi:MAG: adenylate kinase family protein [Candidatus Babeliales bacterium]
MSTASGKKQLVVFIGPPGSGKGSLSQLCVQNFGWKQLSTGYLCRKHINEQTEIGQQIDFSIKSGKLVSDSLIVRMVEEWLIEPSLEVPHIILDGFPRNVSQAEALHAMIVEKLSDFQLTVFKFFVSDEVVARRLLTRFICENKDCQAVYSDQAGGVNPKVSGVCDYCSSCLVKRNDDEEQTIINRLKTYRMHEHELISFYKTRGLPVNEIDAERSLEGVFKIFKNMVFG